MPAKGDSLKRCEGNATQLGSREKKKKVNLTNCEEKRKVGSLSENSAAHFGAIQGGGSGRGK